jgi:hypothetical protein
MVQVGELSPSSKFRYGSVLLIKSLSKGAKPQFRVQVGEFSVIIQVGELSPGL